MNITIRDVAKLAGVSISTVSRVTSNASNVSPLIRKKVQKAIKLLNYTPNIVARSLELRSLQNIAAVMGRTMSQAFSNPGFFEMLHGLNSVITSQGYNSILLTDTNADDELVQCMNLIRSGAVRGIVVFGAFIHDSLILKLLEADFPFVLIGVPPDYPDVFTTPFHYVGTDDKQSSYNAVKYLLECGHRRIGLIHAPLTYSVNRRRYDGYIEAMTEAGLKINQSVICSSEYAIEDSMRAAQKILSKEHRLTALFCTDDYKAAGAMRTAMKMGLRIPDDISIMGHNDYDISKITVPDIATVHLPLFALGEQSGKIILQTIADRSIPAQNTVLPTSIIPRGSVRNLKAAVSK